MDSPNLFYGPTPQQQHSQTPDQAQLSIQVIQDQLQLSSKPNLIVFCAIHFSPVILLCQHPNCPFRIKLCSKCVSEQLEHLNLHSPLLCFDEFMNTLKNVVQNEQVIQILRQQLHISVRDDYISQTLKKHTFAIIDDLINKFMICLQKEIQALQNSKAYLERLIITNHQQLLKQAQYQNLLKQLAQNQDLLAVERYIKNAIDRLFARDLQLLQQTLYNRFDVCNNPTLNGNKQINMKLNQSLVLIQSKLNNFDSKQFIQNPLITDSLVNLTLKLKSQIDILEFQSIYPHTKLTLIFEKPKLQPCESLYKKISNLPIQSLELIYKQYQFPNVNEMIHLPLRCTSYYYDFSDSSINSPLLYDLMLTFENHSRIHVDDVEFIETIKSIGFNLNNTDIKLVSLQILFETILKMRRLRDLDLRLSHNNFQRLTILNRIYFQLPELHNLALQVIGNRLPITDQLFYQVFKDLQKLKLLQSLRIDMSSNRLSSNSVAYLCNKINNLNSLKCISLKWENNCIQFKSVQNIIKQLCKKSMSTIDLQFGDMHAESLEIATVLQYFCKSTSLKNLYLQCHIVNLDPKEKAQIVYNFKTVSAIKNAVLQF